MGALPAAIYIIAAYTMFARQAAEGSVAIASLFWAPGQILPVASERAVLVHEDAVIRTGERNVVFVALGEGRFLPKEVELGLKGEGVYEVKSGLQTGEEVVVSAQFLLDSESRLQDFIRKLTTR